MSRVRIIGGGLTGILAAFQAHRLGARQIDLYERLDQLGGVALSETHDGREVREGCIYFGPQGDPIRALLEAHGAEFVEFGNRFGSVSRGRDGPIYAENFGGPALPASNIDLGPLGGASLGDRLTCYDDAIGFPLARYVRWHLGCHPASLHASAAIPLAINRIFPAEADLDALAAAKKNDGLANEMFGIPRTMWNYSDNRLASLPAGGFAALFRQCREALDAIGVRIHERNLATPKAVLSEHAPGDVLVWAASPMPLFKAMGVEAPRAPAKKFATYTFEVDWTGTVPFYIQNFTTDGGCFRVYIYESNGSVLATAECVVEDAGNTLIGEMQQMVDGFEGELTVGELIHKTVKPRWIYHTVDTIDRLTELRAALAARLGKGFVAGAWEAYAKGEKFLEVEAALRKAFGIKLDRAA